MERKTVPDPQDKKFPFLCSICIPTYNRADHLKHTLESFISAESFKKGKVELVISDNASTDRTREVCQTFKQRYPEQIRYLRHEEEIEVHSNFLYAMDHGAGKFLKLNNDHLYYAPGEFDRFMAVVEEYQDQYEFIFSAGNKREEDALTPLETINDLIRHISYNITLMNLFCIRNEVFQSVSDPFRAWKTCLPHVDLYLRLFDRGCKGLLTFYLEHSGERVIYGTHRNEAQIFGQNYIGMLYAYYKEKKISRKVFQKEKRSVLWNHIFLYHFDFFHQYTAHKKVPPFWRYMGYYKKDPFFYVALVWIGIYYFTSNVIPIHQMLGRIKRALLKKKVS